ncbi:hypothetical protein K440DRAFT_674042 [Wilcoxina mikolae CBS 423.85]|nr:hypothetical protein K440DRAFT_674042 [Wilcoxina mikolae CBS 423.85]
MAYFCSQMQWGASENIAENIAACPRERNSHNGIMSRVRKYIKKNSNLEEINLANVKIEQFCEDQDDLDALLKSGKNQKTILHQLLESRKATDAHLRLHLAKPLLEKNRNLLGVRCNDVTPLTLAINPNHQLFLDYFLDHYTKEARKILNEKDSKSESQCVHKAISKNLDDSAKKMLPYITAEALCRKDSRGNTPLHLAVDFSKWTDWTSQWLTKRIHLIEELIKSCTTTAVSEINNESPPRSPYQFYRDSIRPLEELLEKCAFVARRTVDNHSSDQCRQDFIQQLEKYRAFAAIRVEVVYDNAPSQNPVRDSKATSQDSALKTPVISTFTEQLDKLINHCTPPRDKAIELSDRREFIQHSIPIILEFLSNRTVEFLLKDACMRLPTPAEATAALYGQVQGPQIQFDLQELVQRERPLPENFLDRLRGHLKLEEILRYVYLPPNLINHGNSCTENNPRFDSNTLADKYQPGGKHDKNLVGIFKWLQTEHGVKKILKVTVKDDKCIPHSDDLIISALKDFGVEALDWEKLDMCSQTLYEAAKNLKKVVLYSSGSRAVLRSWSAKDGLISLLNGSESKQRIDDNIKEFHRRLKDAQGENYRLNTNNTNIHYSASGSLSSALKPNLVVGDTVAGEDKKDVDPWLFLVHEFGNFVDNIPQSIDTPTIKVALIDDGVDTFEGYKISKGVSFCMSPKKDDGESPYFISSKGHGTVMADLIYQVFSKFSLHVVKLHHDTQSGSCPTAESAAKVSGYQLGKSPESSHHLNELVNTLQNGDEGNNKHIDELKYQITQAHKENILMFCAANDGGHDVPRDQNFPSSCDKEVFCIGAAKSTTGKPDPRNGNQAVHFTAPGKATLSAMEGREGINTDVKGSSVATALSAGLSALILFCIGTSQYQGLFYRAREFQGMKKILQVLSGSGSSTYLRLQDCFLAEFGRLDWYEDAGEAKFNYLVDRLLRYVVSSSQTVSCTHCAESPSRW